jgi:alkylhydroperoxidase/carboxymuconolactone decarboxylase family protein YurZ
MPAPKAYTTFKDEHPDLVEAYETMSALCRTEGPLDLKTVALVKLAVAVGSGLEGATHSAARKALGAGCTREELLHVTLQGTSTIGFPAMMRARHWVLDVTDKD